MIENKGKAESVTEGERDTEKESNRESGTNVMSEMKKGETHRHTLTHT
jgi:hypothetical protein